MKLRLVAVLSLFVATFVLPLRIRAECAKPPRPPIPISAALCGRALDTAGDVLHGADVTLTGVAPSDIVRTVRTDSKGSFTVPGLPKGNYFLGMPGFATPGDYLQITDPTATACKQPIRLILGVSSECQSHISTGGGLRLSLDAKVPADVDIDDGWAGTTLEPGRRYQYVELVPGLHRVKISALGYEALVFDITTREFQAIPYRAVLKPSRP